MASLKQYADRFRNIKFERRDGILQMQLHTRGGPLMWAARNDESVHAQLGDAFYQVGHDQDNRIVILTGTGGTFLEHADPEDPISEPMNEVFWDRMAREGKDLLVNLLNIDTLIITAVNGPALNHPELATMADIVIASDTASFRDPHMMMGAVPGDGSHVWWTMVLGPNRGRSFLLMGQTISAKEALQLGFVTEVVPQARTLPRAWEIAGEFIKKPPLALRYAHAVLNQDIKRRFLNDLGYGFGLESLAAMSR
jgi:enoyl-CoA hydratase/carnithine racemase